MSLEILDKNQAIDLVLDLASKEGAQAEVILDSAHNFSLKAQKGALSEVVASSSQVMGLRLVHQQRTTVTSSESLSRDSLEIMVRDAIALAALSKQAPEHELMPIGNSVKWDSELTAPKDEVDLDKKSELALSLESEILKKGNGVKSAPYNGYSEGISERTIANTHGLLTSYQDSHKGCYTSALIERDGDQAMSHYSSSDRLFKNLDSELCISQSFERANALIGAKGLTTGRYDVVFETNILQSFWGTFSNIFSAKATVNGLNPFSNKMNQLVASTELTITDRPLVTGGLRTQFFDDEGAASSDVTLIEKGVFKNFLHNHQTALKLKMPNNHRASRSCKSHLSVGHTHFCISPGSNKESEVMGGENLLVITSIQGLSSGSSDISGDFSCGVSGLLYSNGEIVKAFKGVTLSGNWWDMLSSRLSMIGDQIHSSPSKSFYAPTLRWSELQIAGS